MMWRGMFRHQASWLIQNVENRAGTKNAVPLAVTDFGQNAASLQRDDGAHHGAVGHAQVPARRLQVPRTLTALR